MSPLPGDAHVAWVDGLPVRLREPHDLTFLARWGRVTAVFDDQDSGNLGFRMSGPDGDRFVKYAGAATVRFAGRIPDAVAALRAAESAYRDLAHPTLIALREGAAVGNGYALVFDWFEGVSLGLQYQQRDRLAHLDAARRAGVVQQLYDFAAAVAGRGWVAVDLYDASLMVDPTTGRLGVCDIDFFRRAPTHNDMGRMWGSARFMAPEEYERGAVLDQVTNVVALGGLAHTLLGDDRTKDRAAWRGSAAQWDVAARALRPERERRWPSVAALALAWRAATQPSQ
ncbi:serine/threonine protein kinase [Propioniciclava coleopterorum]|uniref:Serine/threonine protein kinase n=1 Tax=Propioniciclava coleopterorum TaxID=2714937 RepID=A0A6G7Y564_9ACTN|nr:serine/threonine protein kinase [Propioniciclava coleopterorum]QIK71962.1 serine/threonine protein kinase [Propioniciclava coleopterorum]